MNQGKNSIRTRLSPKTIAILVGIDLILIAGGLYWYFVLRAA
jgi:hypothetical protein